MTLLQSFITWVEAQPPRRKIDFHSTKMDALAQFARAHFKMPYACGGVYTFSAGEDATSARVFGFELPAHLSLRWAEAHCNSKTFGQLARALAPIKEKLNARD